MSDKSRITERKLISSGAKWESMVGYSRALKVGNMIEISATTAVDEKRLSQRKCVSNKLFLFSFY